MSSNWKNWFVGPARNRELRDTIDLYRRVKSTRALFASEQEARRFIIDLLVEVCARRDLTPCIPLGNALFETVKSLLFFEGILIDPALVSRTSDCW